MRFLVRAAVVSLVLVGLASCGSRTGLFGPEAELVFVDGSIEEPDGGDAAFADARADRDAIPDVIEEPLACVPGTFGLTVATSQLMFVLDRSGSMAFRLDSNLPAPAGTPSRWTALHDALDQAITPFSDQIAMGARFYPAVGVNPRTQEACSQDSDAVAIAPALDNARTILDVFDRTSPVGGTPSAVALQLAATQLVSRRAVVRAMVIATDGAPNCNASVDHLTCTCTSTAPNACFDGVDGNNCLDDTRTIATIAGLYAQQRLPVFVIGIGVTTDFAPTLDAMAVAGGRERSGTPKYYAADTPAQLTAAFTVVRDSVAKCSYITPSSPTDPDAIVVGIAGVQVQRDLTHVDGWDWIDQAFGHLQLFGDACAAATTRNVSATVLCEDASAPDAAK